MSMEHLDVLIVGAGLSGIGAAYHLQSQCPGKRYAILEGRDRIGGTWDLFRYPGIRSDSDMFTLGYSFRPWKEAKAIADGPSILRYMQDTAREYGIDRHIRFGHRITRASWSSDEARWTVEAERGEGQGSTRLSCNFLYLCSGYYSYQGGYQPQFPGMEDFRGRIIHPQQWPEDLDYSGKRVVVIGSGATAVTLVPAMSEKAAHVTMLQRSPSYVMSLPSRDSIADRLRSLLPEKLAHRAIRAKNVGLSMLIYQLSRRRPELAKKILRQGAVAALPKDFDVDTHFKPSYNPWEQRLCLVPDRDLFKSIRRGKASVVTDHIERFEQDGIVLRSGARLPADVVVTATGLNLVALGGIQLSVDGKAVDPAGSFSYRGVMLSGVPNLAACVGYTNASWTLRADLVSAYVCRLLRFMDRHRYRQCTPRVDESSQEALPLLDLTSGYVQRGAGLFPKQGRKSPWQLRQNYFVDMAGLRLSPLEDGALEFVREAASKRRLDKAA